MGRARGYEEYIRDNPTGARLNKPSPSPSTYIEANRIVDEVIALSYPNRKDYAKVQVETIYNDIVSLAVQRLIALGYDVKLTTSDEFHIMKGTGRMVIIGK